MGVRLKRLREERGMTQQALASAIGLSLSYLNQIENNQRPLTVPVLLKLNAAFGIDVQLFSEDDEARLPDAVAGDATGLGEIDRGAARVADSTIYEMEQRGEFPRRFALSPRCVVWDLAEVEAWLAARRASPVRRAQHPDVRQRRARPVRERDQARGPASKAE